MTFKEYIEQENPQHLHYFTVKVTDDDLEDRYKCYGRWIIGLRINDEYYSYILHKRGLYTMDEDGNKLNPTVFYWEGELYNDKK